MSSTDVTLFSNCPFCPELTTLSQDRKIVPFLYKHEDGSLFLFRSLTQKHTRYTHECTYTFTRIHMDVYVRKCVCESDMTNTAGTVSLRSV